MEIGLAMFYGGLPTKGFLVGGFEKSARIGERFQNFVRKW
jgi:hypothetical protein